MKTRNIKTPTEFANHVGMKQPTIYRILSGEIKNPSPETVEPILRTFGINYLQLTGKEHFALNIPPALPSGPAMALAAKWDALPPESKKCVAMMINVLTKQAAEIAETTK